MSTGNLGESVLLPLRLPVPRFHHPGGVLFTNQHRHGVLPAVCRGEGNGARNWRWEQGPALHVSVRVSGFPLVLPSSGLEVSGASTSLQLPELV